MQMYEVEALAQDQETVVYKNIIFAENEDDAIERMCETLHESGTAYEICIAEEI